MTTKIDYAKIGDIAHALTLGNIVAFAYAVVKFANPQGNVFDPVWIEDGFCVANKDVPYWNSHDMCFYVDTIMAAVTFALYLTFRNFPGMDSANIMVKVNSLGTFGHGIGHGAIAQAMRAGKDQAIREGKDQLSVLAEEGLFALVRNLAPIILFWVFLLKASLPNVSNYAIVLTVIPSFAISLLVPPQFGFTYVQTVLFVAFGFNQLSRPRAEKDFAYALFPIMVGFPLVFVGWIESTACSSFVMGLGGHLIYDAYIPLSIIAFYMVCWFREGMKREKKHKAI